MEKWDLDAAAGVFYTRIKNAMPMRRADDDPCDPPDETPEAAENETATALLDATERLLVSKGHAGLSTRRIAEEAGLAHGLIRYHFGSVEELMVQTVERASRRIVARQQELYQGDAPFIDKWRTAMELFEVDLRGGFPKVVAELMALAWNEPRLRPRLRATMESFDEVLTQAARGATVEYGLDEHRYEPPVLATLVRTFQLGMLLERLTGIDIGHAELLDGIDRVLSRLSTSKKGARNAGKKARSKRTSGQ